MSTSETIQKLQSLQEPDRFVDAAIARLMGYERIAPTDGKPAIWKAPDGTKTLKVPLYTRYVQSAKSLSDQRCPDMPVAISWDDEGRGEAIIDGGTRCTAATPAIALCIAALRQGLKEVAK